MKCLVKQMHSVCFALPLLFFFLFVSFSVFFFFSYFCQHFSVSPPPWHFCFYFSLHCQSSYFLIVLASLSYVCLLFKCSPFLFVFTFSYSPFSSLCCLLWHTFSLYLSSFLSGIGEYINLINSSSSPLLPFFVCMYVCFLVLLSSHRSVILLQH